MKKILSVILSLAEDLWWAIWKVVPTPTTATDISGTDDSPTMQSSSFPPAPADWELEFDREVARVIAATKARRGMAEEVTGQADVEAALAQLYGVDGNLVTTA
jgi:hypothetical protein